MQAKKIIEDRYMWWRNGSSFSMINSYMRLFRICNTYVLREFIAAALDMIWNSGMPSKIQCFVRWMLFNKLPTITKLSRRGIVNGSHEMVCPKYFGEEETTNHLFLSC